MIEDIALYTNFDVISEVNCVLIRRKSRFEKKRSHVTHHSISKILKRFRAQRASFFVIFLFKCLGAFLI